MAVDQLFYTSCKKGLSSGMGFQTYSMSEGITDKERQEIERYCVYIPPDNLPTQPSQDEVDKLFPEALSYFILESGRYCICNAKYVGKDYSSRYGNYFCHVLVSDTPFDFYPIELYGSFIFKDNLSYEEENADSIEYLPQIQRIPLGNVIHFDTISQFLRNNGAQRRKKFIELMEAVIRYDSNKKRIIFSDCKDSTPFWIGAVQMSLPKKLAAEFTFTTYSYNPDDVNYVLCAVDQNGSKFNFNDSQKRYKYDTFDFNLNFKNDVICKSSFIKRAEIGYTVSKEVFMPFLNFLDEFEYTHLDHNIDNCVTLYNIVKNGLERCSIEDVKDALSFAIKYKSKSAYNKLFREINSKLQKISTEVDMETLEMITLFLLKVSKSIDNSRYIVNAYRFFFDSAYFIVSSNENVKLNDVFGVYSRVRQSSYVNIQEFVSISLSLSSIQGIQQNVEKTNAKVAEYYLITLISDILAFNDDCDSSENIVLFGVETKHDKEITLLLNNCLKVIMESQKSILEVLNYFKGDYECTAKLMIRMYCFNNYLCKDDDINDLLAEFIIRMDRTDAVWKKKIYSYISKIQPSGDFLFYVYKFELRKNIHNNEFFMEYCREIFFFFKDFETKKFSDALKLYMEVYNSQSMTLSEYKKILNYMHKNNVLDTLDKDVFENFIGDMEKKFNIENSDKENDTIEKILEIKIRYSLKTPCSITELLYIGKRIKNPKLSCKEDLLTGAQFNFSNMSKEEYEKYLRWLLSSLCLEVRSMMDHIKLEKIFFCSKYSDVFYNVYMDIIQDIVFTKKYKAALGEYSSEAYKVFLDFFISVFKDKDNLKIETKNIMYKRMTDVLLDISDKILDEYTVYVRDRTNRLKNVFFIREEWVKIRKIIKHKKGKKGLFKFLKK